MENLLQFSVVGFLEGFILHSAWRQEQLTFSLATNANGWLSESYKLCISGPR